MHSSYPRLVWTKPTGYVDSHCRNCSAAWKRSNKDGQMIVVCLLDREQVLADMTDCDRHVPKEAITSKDTARQAPHLAAISQA